MRDDDGEDERIGLSGTEDDGEGDTEVDADKVEDARRIAEEDDGEGDGGTV